MLVLRLVGSVGANDHDKGRKIQLIRPHFVILEQTERMSQQVNSAIRGQQMSDTELDLTARAAEEVLSTVMRARMNRQTVHAGQQQPF